MTKKIVRVRSGDQTRVNVRFEDMETAPNTIESRYRQLTVIQELLDTPDLLACDSEPFSSLRMWHDGRKWVIEIEALLDQKT